MLPCNEFSIKLVKRHYAPSLLLLNPISETTPALSIMDSLFHRLWLVFVWCLVNISARCLSSLHSPFCCIDLFVHPLYQPLWWEDDLLWSLIPFIELILFVLVLFFFYDGVVAHAPKLKGKGQERWCNLFGVKSNKQDVSHQAVSYLWRALSLLLYIVIRLAVWKHNVLNKQLPFPSVGGEEVEFENLPGCKCWYSAQLWRRKPDLRAGSCYPSCILHPTLNTWSVHQNYLYPLHLSI